MPAGPVGSVWVEDSWLETVWQQDTWADLDGSPEPRLIRVTGEAFSVPCFINEQVTT